MYVPFVMDKMISRRDIFRRVIRYSPILTAAVGVVAMIEAYVIPAIVTSP